MVNLSRLTKDQRRTINEVAAVLAIADRMAKERGQKVQVTHVSNILKAYHQGKSFKVRII